MSRLQIVVICIGVIVVWMSFRWFANRNKQGKGAAGQVGPQAGGAGAGPKPRTAGVDEINAWYQDAREQISMLDATEVARRQRAWDALTDEQKLSLSEDFLRDRFGPKARQGFTKNEKLEIGKTSLLTRPAAVQVGPQDGGGTGS